MAPAARRARGRTPVSVPLRNSLDLTAPSANNVGMVGHETIAGGQRGFHAVERARVPRIVRPARVPRIVRPARVPRIVRPTRVPRIVRPARVPRDTR